MWIYTRPIWYWFRWRATYASTTKYNIWDIVTYNWASYIANNPTINHLPTDILFWDLWRIGNTWAIWLTWPQGVPWPTWNGIQSIILTSTAWKVKTYTITYTDATTFVYTVTDWVWDMLAATYDPTNKGWDAFLMDNMVEWTSKILTATERTYISDSHTHKLNITTNPHNVTKSQVGLWNVDNTTDLLKPISNSTQTALDLKANLSWWNTFNWNQILNNNLWIWTATPTKRLDIAWNFQTTSNNAFNIINNTIASWYTWFLFNNDIGGKWVIFQNGSTRTVDWWPNTFTIRNDWWNMILWKAGTITYMKSELNINWLLQINNTSIDVNDWKIWSWLFWPWLNIVWINTDLTIRKIKIFWQTDFTDNVWIMTATPTQALDVAWNIQVSWAWNWILFPDWTKQTTALWWGWTGLTLYDGSISWPQVIWDVFEVPTAWAWTINAFKISLWTLPVWADFIVTLTKNWTTISTATILTTTYPIATASAVAIELNWISAINTAGIAAKIEPKFGIKFPHIQIRHGVPTIGIVYRRFGVPLSQLIALANVAQSRKRSWYF